MSEDQQNTTQTTTQGTQQNADPLNVGAMPAVGAVGGKERVVQPRPVTGTINPEIAEYVQPGLMPNFGGKLPRSPIEQRVAGVTLYSGEALMDNQGNVTRMPYDTVRETRTELGKLELTERLALLNELYQRGMYPRGSKPSATGFNAPDLIAMGELLDTSNTVYGYEWQTSLNLLRADFPTTGRGRGGRRTAVADIRKSIDQQALEALGRRFTDDEVAGLIAQIQQRESGGDTTSLSTMAEAAVGGAAQQEQTAYKFSQVVNLFNDMLRGG